MTRAGECQVDVRWHRSPRGPAFGCEIGSHTGQLGVEPRTEADDARHANVVEQRFHDQVVEVVLREIQCRERVLARDGFEQRHDVGAAGVDDQRKEPFGLRQEADAAQPTDLLARIALFEVLTGEGGKCGRVGRRGAGQ